MNFGESILFAAIMTLMDEIKEKDLATVNSKVFDTPYVENTPLNFVFNLDQVKSQLSSLAQDLFDKADAACNTEATDVSGEEIVSAIINGIIYETVEALTVDSDTKKEVYEFALQYCNLETPYTWDMISTPDGQLAEAVCTLADTGIEMIVIAANRAAEDSLGTGAIKILAEMMLYVEDAIAQQFELIVLTKRPPLLVIEKALEAGKKELQRMEKKNPELAGSNAPSKEEEQLNRLLEGARQARDSGNMSSAAAYYREALKINPLEWESMFYSAFCSAYRTANNAKATDIPTLTSKISQAAREAIRNAKRKLFTRMEIVTEMAAIAGDVCSLASNYFVAAMNAFRASNGGSTPTMSKTIQVSSIIDMLFVVGDSIEENFGEDFEIGKNVACECWKIGFECYENCNMPAPPKMYNQYLKVLKYDPSFRCKKPLTGGNSEGCYVATAVYGSYDCPQVWTLRRFRDYKLTQNILGRAFIKFYYATSPTFVCLFKDTKWFNAVFRKLLDKFTGYLIENGYKNTPYADGAGGKAGKRNRPAGKVSPCRETAEEEI